MTLPGAKFRAPENGKSGNRVFTVISTSASPPLPVSCYPVATPLDQWRSGPAYAPADRCAGGVKRPRLLVGYDRRDHDPERIPTLPLFGGDNILSSTFGAGTVLPDVIAGCQNRLLGLAVDRFNSGRPLNTDCFMAPSVFGFCEEPAYDRELRGQGIIPSVLRWSAISSFATVTRFSR